MDVVAVLGDPGHVECESCGWRFREQTVLVPLWQGVPHRRCRYCGSDRKVIEQ